MLKADSSVRWDNMLVKEWRQHKAAGSALSGFIMRRWRSYNASDIGGLTGGVFMTTELSSSIPSYGLPRISLIRKGKGARANPAPITSKSPGTK
jgi:hypothetical protein